MNEFDEKEPKPEAHPEQPTAVTAEGDNAQQSDEQKVSSPVNPQPVRRPVSSPYPPRVPARPVSSQTNLPRNPQVYMPSVYGSIPTNNENADNAQNTIKQPSVSSKKTKKQLDGTGKLIAGIVIGVLAVVIISASSIGIYRVLSENFSGNVSGSDFTLKMADTPQTDTTIKTEGEELTPAQVAAKVRPSIVSVITTDNVNYNSKESGEGSGIILSSDGYIVTNSHVIGDSGKYKVSVITSDGKSYDAKVIGYDTHSDLAVLKINAKNLSACEIGDSSKLVLGDYVIAIGNPGGTQFAGSITDGIVSGIDRIIDTTDIESTSAMRYIQTNAAINPGNSGGALVNMYGQVIGVNTSKISQSGYEGMGFAIPSVTVKEVVEDLIQYGYVKGRVKLGITCVTISNAYENQGIPAGLQIYSVDSDSDMNGKVQVSDIITHCNGKRITSLSQLQDIIFTKKPGDKVELTIYRPASAKVNASSYKVNVKLLEDIGAKEESDNDNSSQGNDKDQESNNPFFSDFFGNDKNY